jgi:hypothetical protein
MSNVQTPKPKPYNKVMNTPTNSIEMISSKLWMHQKKNGINWTPGYQDMTKTVNKHCWRKSPVDMFGLDRICLVSADISDNLARYVRPTKKFPPQLWFLSYGAPKLMKLGHKGHLNTSNNFPMMFFPKSKDFLSDFGWTKRIYVLGEMGEIHQIEWARAMDSFQDRK